MAHTFRFVRYGGFDQVQLATGKDLAAIGELDQKLWVALACPIKGLSLDERTLALVDRDGDGRIRANELIAAVRWAAERVKNVEVLADGRAELPLAEISTQTPDGLLLADTAKRLLSGLGKAQQSTISVEEVKAALAAFSQQAENGDGVVPAEVMSDAEVKQVASEVLAATAAPPLDRSARPGVSRAVLADFFGELSAYSVWLKEGQENAELSPLGADTAKAYEAFAACKGKVEDYFARCRVLAYDARAELAVRRDDKDYLTLIAKELDGNAAELAPFPLARVAGSTLPLGVGLNPAWQARMDALIKLVLVPILGSRSELTENDWRKVVERFAAYAAYLGRKRGQNVEKLGRERVEQLLASDLRARLEALIEADEKAAAHAAVIDAIERLVRYKRDLFELANNFVCFRDFYARIKPAAFQAGVLYIDTRACELCLRVEDAPKNASMAPLANSYLLYCDCRNAKGEKLSIAAAVTAGDLDSLMVGRNGIFYDRTGGEWDATVTKIVDHPISVRQGFWSPYKKAVRLIEEQIQKRVASADAEAHGRVGAAATATANAGAPGATPPPAAPKKLDIGVVAALGVAVGGITAALGVMMQAFFGLGIWMPIGLLGLLLAISGPAMGIAWLKLRKRSLGPLLDANGWAVNAQARVNVPFGGSLTKLPELPKGATRDLHDPYAPKKTPWWLYFLLLVVIGLGVAIYMGKIDLKHYLPHAAEPK